MNNFESNAQSLSAYVSSVMKQVYMKMTLALIVTAVTAWFCGTSYSVMYFMANNSWVYWGLLILELVMVFSISGAINKLSSSVSTLLFYGYAIVNGIVFSVILQLYTAAAIWQTFAITAGVFGAMTIYGLVTKSDLTKMGTFLTMGLFGLMIAIVVNIFWANSTMDWLISIAGVAIFVGLTAWDTQKIKNMAAMTDSSNVGRLATIGALSLYLDFVNLFLYLLRIFGGSRD